MIIEQFTLNVPPGRGPVEVVGELPEMLEVARLFGYKRFASWRIVAFSLIDHARGKLPTVMLTRNETTTLCRIAAATAFTDTVITDLQSPRTAAMLDTGVLASDMTQETTQTDVIDTVLTYAHTSPPHHELL